MKRMLKRILILSVLAAAGLVAFRVLSRRRSRPSEPYRWSPPAAPPPAVHVEVHTSESEARSPVEAASEPESTAAAEAVDAPATAAIEMAIESPVRASVGEAPTPTPEVPASDQSSAGGQPTGVNVPGASADPDFLTSYFEKVAETPDEQLVERLAGLAEPGLELVAEVSAPETERFSPPPPPEPPHALAEASTQAAETPAESAEPETSWESPAASAVHSQGLSEFPEALEEALTELAPMPIVPPPRRTAESYLDEGNVYFNVGQYKLAIERYTTAVEMDRDLVAAYYNRANARTRSGEFESALSDYDRALVLQPFDADALNNRGMLHLYRANYADALRDFNAALVIDPADTTVMVNRGLAHLHSGDASKALENFREAATVDGEDAAAHYGASQASAVLGNTEEALLSVARALELNPGYAREAAGDPNLTSLQGDPTFLKLLRDSGAQ